MSASNINSRQSIAIVGSGPAGFGVATALTQCLPNSEITLFDHGEAPKYSGRADLPGTAPIDEQYDEIYRFIWSTQKRIFPPPKTHFGHTLPKNLIDGKERIFRSESLGGLSNFWGGTCLPFTDRELQGWPVDRATIDPYYRKIAEIVGISGREDALSTYFGDSFVNRPSMHVTRLCSTLERSINETSTNGAFDVKAGINRCALETRAGQVNSCVSCGECLAGCVRDSIFSARHAISRLIMMGKIKLSRAKVLRFESSSRELTIGHGDGVATTQSFDRIYLAAGCPNTTEIVMRSLGLDCTSPMADNAVYVFPIFYTGKSVADTDNAYLSLTNLIVGLLPRHPELQFAQAQIYTNFDYMWRYNIPPSLWSVTRGLVRWSRDRLLWGRLYTHGDLSQSYRLSLQKDKLHFEYDRSADQAAAHRLMEPIRSTLNKNGFYVPRLPLIHQKSNTHYAGTLPYGGKLLDVPADAQIAPGVFVCDSSVFPSLPAVSLTFTIMANACRIATESL